MFGVSMHSVSVMAVVCCAGVAQGGAFFLESDFGAGTWEDGGVLLNAGGAEGNTASSVSERFVGGAPANAFILQQITVSSESGVWGVRAPVWMNDFVYTPSVDGAIESLGGSVTTLEATGGQAEHRGSIRLFAQQGGSTFMLGAILNDGVENVLDAPNASNAFSGVEEDSFIELLPDGGIGFASHPDFSSAGSEIRFGFGWSLNQPLAPATTLPPTTFLGAFDDVSLRISVVPAPGAGACLLGAGLLVARRRR